MVIKYFDKFTSIDFIWVSLKHKDSFGKEKF